MSTPPGNDRPRLHVVRPAAAVDGPTLMAAVESCVAARAGGMPPAELMPALAAHLGVEQDAIAERDLDVAMGMLVVGGRIDETAGLLVAPASSSSSVATG